MLLATWGALTDQMPEEDRRKLWADLTTEGDAPQKRPVRTRLRGGVR